MKNAASSHTARRHSPRKLALIALGSFVITAACAVPLTATAASNVTAVAAATVVTKTAMHDARAAADFADQATADVAKLGLDLGEVATTVDTSSLRTRISNASVSTANGDPLSDKQTATLSDATETVRAQTLTLRKAVVQAQATAAAAKIKADEDAKAAEAARVAAEQAAAAAVAQAEADAAAAAEALAKVNTVDGAKETARTMAKAKYGWGDDQFGCLDSLWTKESGWNYQAENASSGAFGIPQSLPGSKMATIADDWADNAATQIEWGLKYISGSYGTPCAAWGHSQATDWY